MGRLLRNLPIVVCLVLVASLIESLLILPAHLAAGKHKVKLPPIDPSNPSGKKPSPIRTCFRIAGTAFHGLAGYSGLGHKQTLCPTGGFLRDLRYANVAVGILVITVTFGLLKAEYVRETYRPDIEGDTMSCMITMPSGTPKDRTSRCWVLWKKRPGRFWSKRIHRARMVPNPCWSIP